MSTLQTDLTTAKAEVTKLETAKEQILGEKKGLEDQLTEKIKELETA